jgi:hypothetical protein
MPWPAPRVHVDRGFQVTAVVVCAWLAVAVFACIRHRSLFREVVLRRPVLVFESDDWGPGPPEDALRLRDLTASATAHRDAANRPATITIGVVLSVADTPLVDMQSPSYSRITLDSQRFHAVRNALLEGERRGVFSLQLHGGEHYWPDALLAAAASEKAVAQWLASPGPSRTESLPSHLQSRWIDASTLPSKPLESSMISHAADEEVRLFQRVFGRAPQVVVPPTFVWDQRVESAWARHGVKVVITPGCRTEGRDVAGNLQSASCRIYNGARSEDGLVYLVRDVYFEPALGHRAEDVVARIIDKTRLGRPALVEMHRFNFVDDIDKARASVAEFELLLGRALEALPQLRFVSPGELAQAILRRDPALIETRWLGCLAIWLKRLWRERRLRWLAFTTGAVVPAVAAWAVASILTGKLWREAVA